MTVANDTFTGNSATDGGGIYNEGTLTVDNSTFTNNSGLVGDSSCGGGGIYNGGLSAVGGVLIVTNSNFTNNTGDCGGGISNQGALTVTDSTFTDNPAVHGGGIYNRSSLVTVTSSTFTGNSSNDGGGIYNDLGTLMATDNTFINNSAFGGGGILTSGTTTVENSTFNGNSALEGGGYYPDYGNGGGIQSSDQPGNVLTIINSTFVNNSAVNSGGGIGNIAGVLTIDNTIVATNTGGDVSGQIDTSSSNNLIGDGTGITNLVQLSTSNLIGTTAKPINPLLGPLANNGGPTQTMALLPGSPAINAGNTTLAVDANGNQLTVDQRGAGHPRVIGPTVDIGAYEFALSGTFGTWTAIASLPVGRGFLGAATGNDGTIYAIGGLVYGDGHTAEVDAYNPVTKAWTKVASLPTAAAGGVVAVTGQNGIIYAIGAGNGDGTDQVNAYNPATNIWTVEAPVPNAASNLAAAYSNGIIYAIGGSTTAGITNEVWKSAPKTDPPWGNLST